MAGLSMVPCYVHQLLSVGWSKQIRRNRARVGRDPHATRDILGPWKRAVLYWNGIKFPIDSIIRFHGLTNQWMDKLSKPKADQVQPAPFWGISQNRFCCGNQQTQSDFTYDRLRHTGPLYGLTLTHDLMVNSEVQKQQSSCWEPETILFGVHNGIYIYIL